MPRPKPQPHPMLQIARDQVCRLDPDLEHARFAVRLLDGPPGAPRFVVTATRCPSDCACPNRDALAHCPRRLNTRLLLSREGALIQASEARRLDQR